MIKLSVSPAQRAAFPAALDEVPDDLPGAREGMSWAELGRALTGRPMQDDIQAIVAIQAAMVALEWSR